MAVINPEFSPYAYPSSPTPGYSTGTMSSSGISPKELAERVKARKLAEDPNAWQQWNEGMSDQDIINSFGTDAEKSAYSIALQDEMATQLYGQMPEFQFQSLIDPKTGMLAPQYQLEAQVLDPTQVSGFGQFEKFATGVGPSEYAQEAMRGLDLRTALERDRAAAEANQAAAQQRSALAMRGGLSSGARERVGQRAALGGLESRQAARQAQLLGEAGIRSEDARARQGALERFTGMGLDVSRFNLGQKQGAQEFNIAQALQEVGQGRQYGAMDTEQKQRRIAAQKKSFEERLAADKGGFNLFDPSTW